MKVIQIGVGGFGKHWVRVLNDYPGIDVVAQVDLDKAALMEAAEIGKISTAHQYTTLHEALKVEKAEILLCVTPPKFHKEQAIMGMCAGLDVILEKPLAETLEDARAIADVAYQTGNLVAVSQNYRFRPPTWSMRWAVANDEIGEIGQVFVNFFKGWYFDENNFRRFIPDPLLLDMAIHHFDLLRFISGLNAVSVRGESWNPPWSKNAGDTSIALTYTLENGARFIYNASWCSQGDFVDWNGDWVIDGDQGSITLRQGVVKINHVSSEYTAVDTRQAQFDGPSITDQAYILADMIAAREERRQPITNVFDNLHSLVMVTSAVDAIRTSREVRIPKFEYSP